MIDSMHSTPGQGRLEAIWLKRDKLAPMDRVKRVRVVAHNGLEGNANQGGKRQITLLSRERWAAVVDEIGQELDPALRRANLLLSGIDLRDCQGRVLQIGEVGIRIHGETRPCELMDRSVSGLQKALQPDWRGGVFGEAIDSGWIEIGSPTSWR